MGQLVVNNGLCSCSMGTAPCALVFLPIHMASGSKQPAANIMDFIPYLNVSGFAMCNSMANPAVAAATAAKFGAFTPAACIPTLPAPWAPGAIKTTIGKFPALDSSSVLTCAYGGVISITYAGEATITVS
ncbi:DUF4280 domain-containing protein [Candidatus Paracaedibacter symbiosus]|uniref:DUF4280 domain-containing protein n=1 Tax=Candidatus Paracaedibacter symbiosus TaxID=244582 RepID=UPI0005095C66|nr:DUF4280 domain-containing protein [Candidatus Paracaedibacter symbiosus]